MASGIGGKVFAAGRAKKAIRLASRSVGAE